MFPSPVSPNRPPVSADQLNDHHEAGCSSTPHKPSLASITEHIVCPDLMKYAEPASQYSGAQLKKHVILKFRGSSEFQALCKQTRQALAQFRHVLAPHNQSVDFIRRFDAQIHALLDKWGLNSACVTHAEELDPDLFDLYSLALPKLAKAVAVEMAISKHPAMLDATDQGAIRQILRDLFPQDLTVCTPGVIQNIEAAWGRIGGLVNPPNFKEELTARKHDAYRQVIQKHVHQTFSQDSLFEGNQIHMVAAVQNHFAQELGLPTIEDKYASSQYAATVVNGRLELIRADFRRVSDPVELIDGLASDVMQQLRGDFDACHIEDANAAMQKLEVMAAKVSRQYVGCSPYTLSQVDPVSYIPCRVSPSCAALAMSMIHHAEKTGLFEPLEKVRVEIPRAHESPLKVVQLGHLVCVQEPLATGQTLPAFSPLCAEDLLPGAIQTLKSAMASFSPSAGMSPSLRGSPALLALFEAMKNSSGGAWSSIYRQTKFDITIEEASLFLNIMAGSDERLASLANIKLGTTAFDEIISHWSFFNQHLLNSFSSSEFLGWFDLLERSSDASDAKAHLDLRIQSLFRRENAIFLLPLAKAALDRNIVVECSLQGRLSRFELLYHTYLRAPSPEWVRVRLSLAPPKDRDALMVAMVRGVLLDVARVRPVQHKFLEILDVLHSQGACVFKNQEISWHACSSNMKHDQDYPTGLPKLLEWMGTHVTTDWSESSLATLLMAVEKNLLSAAVVKKLINSEGLRKTDFHRMDPEINSYLNEMYINSVRRLFSIRTPDAVHSAFGLIGFFLSKGFPSFSDNQITIELRDAIKKRNLPALEEAAQARLIPEGSVLSLLNGLADLNAFTQQDAVQIAECLLRHYALKGMRAEHFYHINAVSNQERYVLAKTLVEGLIGGPDQLNRLNGNGFGIMHQLAINNHAKVIRAFVAAGADINIKASATHHGKSPLHYAIRENNAEAKAVLIELGANQNQLDDLQRKPGERGLKKRLFGNF